jgi:hypothetical protein
MPSPPGLRTAQRRGRPGEIRDRQTRRNRARAMRNRRSGLVICAAADEHRVRVRGSARSRRGRWGVEVSVVYVVGTVLLWVTERGQKGGDVHGIGDAAFFAAVLLLNVVDVNPLTPAGRVVDVVLEF